MLDVTQATKDSYINFGSGKELTLIINNHVDPVITLTNTDIVAQSLTLTERLETEENLTFTGCIASVLQFRCRDIDKNIKGADISGSVRADNTEMVPLFHGIIDDVTNTSHEQATMSITAYDKLYLLSDVDMKSWYEELTFPMTLQQFRNALFTYLYNHYNLQQEDSYLINDNMIIYKAIDSENIACLDLLKWICQINGNYGRINRYGKFEYLSLKGGLFPNLTLYPSNDLYPSISNIPESMDKGYYTSIDFENYTVQPITQVNLRGKSDEVIASYGINSNNIFNISTNPFVWEYSETSPLYTVAKNLYDEICDLDYIPLNHLDLAGLPYIEVGDFITVEAKRSTINTFIFERSLTGTQALKDSYISDGDESYPIYNLSIKKQTDINRNIIDNVSEEVDGKQNNINFITEVPTGGSDGDISFYSEDGGDTYTPYVNDNGTWTPVTIKGTSGSDLITYGTEPLTPRVSSLATGTIYVQYE